VKDSGLKLAIRKSEFAKPEVTFCGSIVGSGKRRIDPSKIQAIENLKRPETKAQVRQILGLFGWFRDYIPHYAEHAIPLSNLTSKRIPNRVPWGEIEDNSFVTLKDLLCKAVDQPLSIIDWSKPFNTFTDASDLASGGVLSQTDENGKERPIAFCSKKFNETQRAWATIEREAFAVLEALKRFNMWIFGCKIHMYSDHNPLAYLTESATKSAKLLRWALALQNFDLCFHYQAGSSDAMAAPDCLSRL
jgi:hypothetical protein